MKNHSLYLKPFTNLKFTKTLIGLCLLPLIIFKTDISLASSVSPPIKCSEQSTILVLGDSLSSAQGIDPDKGWVSLLSKRLKQENSPYCVVNLSTSGDTSRNGLLKLDSALKTYKPSIVILGLGSNDGLRGLSTEALYQNLDKIIIKSKETGAKVLLIGLLIPKNYGPIYRTKFEQVFKDLAEKHHLAKVPFLLDKVALSPELMQEDGLHPNEKAEPIILDNVWIYLKNMI
jgi:acyl-CoA thioesterase-1